ncbi:MAG: homoserine dehydrogenase, partial [Actinobacteria bacterium]|nr:homoserine dehydrogenase [Actinomycetota bacterium]
MTTPDELPRELTVALLGGGNVGSQVSRLLAESADDLTARAGATLRLVGVGVRDTSRRREGVDPALITGDLEALASSGADIVVELLGGIEPARTLILAAMAAGSSVVTANKALLAEDGATLHAAAER